MDIIAPFDTHFKVLYDFYKWIIPTSRFWEYYEYLHKYYENQNKTPEDIKREKVERVDWQDEVNALKRKLNGRRKT